jgi:hypothetical protein
MNSKMSNFVNMKNFQDLYEEKSNSLQYLSVDSKILMQKIKSAILLFIIFIGIIGNLLNLVVFRKKSMFEISTFKYLFALSLNNLLVLGLAGSDVFMSSVLSFEIRNYSIGFCKFHTYLTYVITHASSMILTAVNIERALLTLNVSRVQKRKRSEMGIRYSKNKFENNFQKTKNSEINEIEILSITDNSFNTNHKYKENFFCLKKFIDFAKKNSAFVGLSCIMMFVIALNFHYLLFLELVNPQEDRDQGAKKTYFLKNSPFKNSSLFLAIQKIADEKLDTQETMCYASKVSDFFF